MRCRSILTEVGFCYLSVDLLSVDFLTVDFLAQSSILVLVVTLLMLSPVLIGIFENLGITCCPEDPYDPRENNIVGDSRWG